MKARFVTRLIVPSALVIFRVWSVSLEAGLAMHYTGPEFQSIWPGGALTDPHHLEAVVEFDSLGDFTATSIIATILDSSGKVLLEIPSVGPAGSVLWTGTFEWTGNAITDWAWRVQNIAGYPPPIDYVESVMGPSGFYDQVLVGNDASGWVGAAEVKTLPAGTWILIPEPRAYFFTSLGLVAFVWCRRAIRRGRQDTLPNALASISTEQG